MAIGTSIHFKLTGQHGQEALTVLREVEKIIKHLSRWRNHRIYNIRCLRTGICTKSISIKTTMKGNKVDKETRRAIKNFTNIQVDQCTFTIKKLEDSLEDQLQKLFRFPLSIATKEEVENHLDRIYHSNFLHVKNKQMKKFTKQRKILLEKDKTNEGCNILDNFDKNRWVINKSSLTLSEQQTKLLQKGLNFAVTPMLSPYMKF